MELIVAVALLAIIMAIAGVIFRIALSSYRLAAAQAEIMGKLRIVTTQLDGDFQGLRTDTPIYIGWVAQADANQLDHYRSLDRIVFFARGAFESMGRTSAGIREGSDARITYMLARVNGQAARTQRVQQRILGRTQHIMSAPRSSTSSIDEPNDAPGWFDWHNDPNRQYDDRFYRSQQWLTMDAKGIEDAMIGMTGMDPNSRTLYDDYGTDVNTVAPGDSLAKILCQGVGQFRVQGWFEGTSGGRGRWVPDPNQDLMDAGKSGTLLYFPSDPAGIRGSAPYGYVRLEGAYDEVFLNRTNPTNPLLTKDVPGLGRALRFTFTLYDSKGLIPEGMTFSHIVYLDR
jgi:hypothetical protein